MIVKMDAVTALENIFACCDVEAAGGKRFIEMLAECGYHLTPIQPVQGEREVLERAIDRMGWPEIDAFRAEMARGQSIFEDAGGYFMRAIRRLFGLPQQDAEVVTYQDAARRLVAEHYRPTTEPGSE